MDAFVSALNAHIESKGLIGEYIVHNFDDFGPSLVAEKNYNVGDVVVSETALYITTDDIMGSFESGSSLDQLCQLFKVTADTLECTAEIVKSIEGLGEHSVATDKVVQLRDWISAFSLNGYSLSGSNKTGLFVIASKVAHSCAPNVATITSAEHDRLVFTAMKPIAKGDLIFSSYLAGAKLAYPTRVRQEFIRHKYYFDCRCPRCRAVDDLRALKCGVCDTGTVWLDSLAGVWTCGAGGPCDATGCCGATFSGAKADDELYTDVEEQAEEQLRVFDDVGGQCDAAGQRVLMGTAESVFTLEKYLPLQHWTVPFMKRVVVEGLLRSGRGLTDIDMDRFVVDLARWARYYLAPHSPVSAACLLHTYTKCLFGLLPVDVSTQASAPAVPDHELPTVSVSAAPVREQQAQEVLHIMRFLFPFYEIQYGAQDADVVEWRSRVGL